MAQFQLFGSGGYVIADISEELAKKADLGVGKLFLAPVGKLEQNQILKHFCKECDKEFENPPNIQLEEKTNEEVAENLNLIERGQYICQQCSSIIGEYRVFEQRGEVGNAKPTG